jgi:hypothetical protein
MESWMTDLIVSDRGRVGRHRRGVGLEGSQSGQGGDAITGAIGGGVVGQILTSVLGGDAAAVGGMDVASLVKSIFGGGIGGAIVMAIIGALRNAMMKC